MLKPLVYKSDDADREGGDTGPQSWDKPSNTGLLVDFFNSFPILIVFELKDGLFYEFSWILEYLCIISNNQVPKILSLRPFEGRREMT